MSDITKGYNTKKNILFWISVALNVVPMLIFFFIGFKEVEVTKKVILSFTGVAALVLGGFMIVSKLRIKRTIFWICFLVLYFCMQDLYSLILAMGICTIVDEILVSPLHKYYKDKTFTNKEIDKRLEG